MRLLILLAVSTTLLLFGGSWLLTEDWKFAGLVAGIALAIFISGALQSYFFYKRGKVYEKRGESGPDD